MTSTLNPLLYQINTRVLLRSLSDQLHRPATLDDISDATLEGYQQMGFEWLYLLGVWQTGVAALDRTRTNPAMQVEYRAVLPDLTAADIVGSCFAITGYTVSKALGGDEAMQSLHARCARYGLQVMLDFIPNHTAIDHPWVKSHPDYFVHGTPEALQKQPQNYINVGTSAQPLILAHGRDPYFPGWSDTLQIDYSRPAVVAAMQSELLRAAALCDGLRCDMAMLILPEIFERTWGKPALPFWSHAIQQVQTRQPGFTFMAEVYWDLEPKLLKLGFDYTYDKRLYDYLRDRNVSAVRTHLKADPRYLSRMVHFLENHDEQRAAQVFPFDVHKAAALLAFLAPGVRFFHQGELEGKRVKIPVQLNRGPVEAVDPQIQSFYQMLLEMLRQPIVHSGDWRLLTCRESEKSRKLHPSIIAFEWRLAGMGSRVIAVNYADTPVHGILSLPQACAVDLPGWGYAFIETVESQPHA